MNSEQTQEANNEFQQNSTNRVLNLVATQKGNGIQNKFQILQFD